VEQGRARPFAHGYQGNDSISLPNNEHVFDDHLVPGWEIRKPRIQESNSWFLGFLLKADPPRRKFGPGFAGLGECNAANRHSLRLLKPGVNPGPVMVADGLQRRQAGDGRNHSRGRDLTDALVPIVCDPHVSRGIHRNADRIEKARGDRGEPVAMTSRPRRAGESRHGAGGGDFANDEIARVCNVEVAGRVDGQSGGVAELRRRPQSVAITGEISSAGERRDVAGRSDFADGMSGGVRHEHIAR